MIAASQSAVLVPLPSVLGIDLSLTHDVAMLWLAALLTAAVLIPACRRRDPVPHGFLQNLVDALVEFVNREVIGPAFGGRPTRWAPFLLALFLFILFMNLTGLIPVPPYTKSATSTFSVTAALAVTVFVLSVGVSIHTSGLLGFLRRFVPADLPVMVAVLAVPIEVVSWLARPVSLAIRLFANMLVGHHLIFIFIGMEYALAWWLKPLPLVGAVLMNCFELFVCFVQAFIFTMLAALYLREALEEGHGGEAKQSAREVEHGTGSIRVA